MISCQILLSLYSFIKDFHIDTVCIVKQPRVNNIIYQLKYVKKEFENYIPGYQKSYPCTKILPALNMNIYCTVCYVDHIYINSIYSVIEGRFAVKYNYGRHTWEKSDNGPQRQ